MSDSWVTFESVKHVYKKKYPNLMNFILKMMHLFGSTYSCERFFLKTHLKNSENRSRITDTNLENLRDASYYLFIVFLYCYSKSIYYSCK